ncbi:MAG: hypothetical protein U1E10_04635 [Bdellovibrionales bacterium]|nr:hypothetical protein [Bdellovibrionales bacterium]
MDRPLAPKPSAPKTKKSWFTTVRQKVNVENVFSFSLIAVGIALVGFYFFERANRSEQDRPQVNTRSTASAETTGPAVSAASVASTPVAEAKPIEASPITFATLEKKYPTVGLYTDGETDAWPPIPMANLRIGTKVIYRDKRFYGDGKARMVRELWELVGFEGNTLKWKLQEIDKQGNLLFNPWHAWYRNNAQLTADTKGEASHFLSAFEVSIVGNPDEIFPMRNGRVVVHETYGELGEKLVPIRMRTISVVRNKEVVSTAIGSVNAVRVDAYFESGLSPEIIYYSPEKQLVVLWKGPRLDRRPYEIVKELEAVLEEGKGDDFQSHLQKLGN